MEEEEIKEIMRGMEKAIVENNPLWVCYEAGIAVEKLNKLISKKKKKSKIKE